MLSAIIDASLKMRPLVLLAAAGLVAVGAWAVAHLDVDAFPDTTPVQVAVNVSAPTLGPLDVESQITAPIEQALGGLPRLQTLRSVSKFGLSQVVATFADGVDVFFARQQIGERLATIALPEGVERPSLGPVATGLGEVFHYVVRAAGWNAEAATAEERAAKLAWLRTIHDWTIRPRMRTVPGVAEINSWGGYERQLQVSVSPVKLLRHGVSFEQVLAALAGDNRNAGGGGVRKADQFILVQGVGRTADAEQLGAVVVSTKDGNPIRVRNVATVAPGEAIRRGAVTYQGRGEAVLGLCFMTMGENSRTVAAALRKRLDEIRAELPTGIDVEVVYDRTELVDVVISTVRRNLFEGGLLVLAVLFAFLGNLRAAFIVALAIPLSMIFAFSGMARFGIAASLLSLGALDFGLVVDSSVVLMENCVRRLSTDRADGRTLVETIRDAAVEVRAPTLFGELIIMIVYLPILTLEGVEGKLFRPMALTVVFALLGSMILSMTLMPVLASLSLRRGAVERESLPMRLAHALHNPVLAVCMNHRWAVALFSGSVTVFAFGMILPSLGSEFVPKLSEGALAVNVVRLAGTDLAESNRINTAMERLILEKFPDEVLHVWSRVGTAEVATDPMGIELTDLYVTLKPRSTWKKATTQEQLVAELERELRVFPGQRLSFSQPIELRMNEMASGVRSDVGVKLFGDDFDVLTAKANEVSKILQSIPGAADVAVEQVVGQPAASVKPKRDELARYGVQAKAVMDLVRAVGGLPVGEVIEGQVRVPLVVRLADVAIKSPDLLERMQIATPSGGRLPFNRLAEIQWGDSPSTITREWGRRRVTVTANVRGRDMGGFVEEARAKTAEKVTLPVGRYHLEWGGQFENYERARLRLAIVVPLAATMILVLLVATYGNLIDALRVFCGVPFGWVGGLVALWLRDMPLSISAIIGFIALSGVAVLDDMILVSTIRRLKELGVDVHEAVRRASVMRLRPVLMTTLVASLGFLPMAFSDGQGAEVQRPLATVVIGGVIGAMAMSLLALRTLYLVFDAAANVLRRALRRLGLGDDAVAALVGREFETVERSEAAVASEPLPV